MRREASQFVLVQGWFKEDILVSRTSWQTYVKDEQIRTLNGNPEGWILVQLALCSWEGKVCILREGI
jgi:hypothetical protein